MKISDPKNVKYLALEGGGGKGVTYLGAIQALEQLKILPINVTKPEDGQIKGISGASAGAITALLLSMGVRSAEIRKILSKPETFIGFFDGPDPGYVRAVDQSNKAVRKRNQLGPEQLDFIEKRGLYRRLYRILAVDLAAGVKLGAFGDLADPIQARIVSRPEEYLYNLMFDKGLFPGFAPRRFLASMIDYYLGRQLLKLRGGDFGISSPNGSDIGFELLYEATGVDLVITGANTTKRKPAIFSRRHTPEFPVAEAVGISMNLPILFKPVYVEADVPTGQVNEASSDYHGNWVDGGLLNNLPLHAFDHVGPTDDQIAAYSYPLNPNILALRLTEGPPGSEPPSGRNDFSTLFAHVGDVIETLMFPSEQGQIRTPEEASQTIDLFTYDLKTTEFAPPPEKSVKPIASAKAKVMAYFGPAGQ